MRIVSSDKTVLLLIGMVIVIAGWFTYAQRQQPQEVPQTNVVKESQENQTEEDWSTPEALLKEKVRSAVSEDIVRTIGIEYDREYDAYKVVVALDDILDEEDFSTHAPSTKLYYDLYKQKDIPVNDVVVSVYQERTNYYDSLERIKVYETQMTKETVENTINFSPTEAKVRDMIRQKWTVLHDQRTVEAKLAERRAKKTLRSRYSEIKTGMTEEAVEEILGQDGACSKDSTMVRQAKECIYAEQVHIHYLNAYVTGKEFVRKRAE